MATKSTSSKQKMLDPQARRMTVYETRPGRPRWVLHMQAVFWRVLMGLGMFFHRLAPPRPPKPNFSRTIPSTISGKPGDIRLDFYVPKDYETQRRIWMTQAEQEAEEQAEAQGAGLEEVEQIRTEESVERSKSRRMSQAFSDVRETIRRRSLSARKCRWGGYPVVLNFHGGGFTLGSPGDDARWCGTVVDECHAVVVSVDYRLAPENPFPTAVEDGVDAVLYIHQHADELGIDKDKIGLSGFSSGGNMAFTVPLRLYDEITGFPRKDVPARSATARHAAERVLHGTAYNTSDSPSPSSSTTKVAQPESSSSIDAPKPQKSNTTETIQELSLETAEHTTSIPADIKIRVIVPWYPPVDYTRTRAQRRETCRRADQELPALFTNLFDESYLHPPHTIALDSPYLSPGVAPTSLLRNALPTEIIMHTCEWDMLLDEGEAFRERLTSPEIGKKVWYHMVEGVPHGWDKAPNPWKPTPGVREHYLRACKEMRRVFGPEQGPQKRPTVERLTTKGQFPTAAARGSVAVVR